MLHKTTGKCSVILAILYSPFHFKGVAVRDIGVKNVHNFLITLVMVHIKEVEVMEGKHLKKI